MYYVKFIFLVLLFLSASTLWASESVVLNGTPIIQAKGNLQESKNTQLSESQKNEYRILITKEGDNYFWATRENRPLIKTLSGEFSIFIDPLGSGSVRVAEKDGLIMYLEQMAIGFQTVSYWGTASSFSP
jgi:hypothetical protein